MGARLSFRDSRHLAPARGLTSRVAVQPADDLVFNLAWWTLALLPVNWLLGTTLLWLFGAAAVCLLKGRSISVLEPLFLWLIAALFLGLFIAMARGKADGDRALASVFNISIIVVLIGFLNAGFNIFQPSEDGRRPGLFRLARTLFLINSAFILVVYAVTRATGSYEIAFPTLALGLLGKLPGIFGEYAQVYVSVIDWTVAGPEPRVVGFGLYATEGALIFMLFGLFAGIAAVNERRFGWLIAFEAMMIVGLILMASRTTLLAYAVSALLLLVLWRGPVAKAALLALPVVAVGGIIVLFYGGDAIDRWLVAQNESRLGSSGTRFLSYLTAMHMVIDQNILTGLGIKPRDDSIMLIPIGSHSSVSSIFTKGGLIGLAILTWIYVTLLWGIVQAQVLAWLAPVKRLDFAGRFELVQLSRCVLVTLVWWLTEDFDAPAHEAALAGLCFGLFWGCLKRLRAMP